MQTIKPRMLRHARKGYAGLSNNSTYQFAIAHALSIYQASAIYTFIPKNACSTLRYSVARANGCIWSDDDIHWIHNNSAGFRSTLAELATAKYSFVVLRDPFRRIASCFLDKFVDRNIDAWRFVELAGYRINLESLTFRQFIKELPDLLYPG